MKDTIPVTPLFDRARALRGYKMNKMANGLSDLANRQAFLADETAYIDSFGLTGDEKKAVMDRDWHEMVRLGGNLFFILKITAVDPTSIINVGAAQAGMEYNEFLSKRLGKN